MFEIRKHQLPLFFFPVARGDPVALMALSVKLYLPQIADATFCKVLTKKKGSNQGYVIVKDVFLYRVRRREWYNAPPKSWARLSNIHFVLAKMKAFHLSY